MNKRRVAVAMLAATALTLFSTGAVWAQPAPPLPPGHHSTPVGPVQSTSPGMGVLHRNAPLAPSATPMVDGQASGFWSGNSCATITAPAGQQTGDLIIAITYGYTAPTNYTAPAGFTELSDDNTFVAGSVNGHVWQGVTASNYRFCGYGSGMTTVLAISGSDGHFPVNVMPVWHAGYDKNQDQLTTDVTPTLPNTLLIGAAGTDSTGTSKSYTIDSQLTQQSNVSVQSLFMAVGTQQIVNSYLTPTGTRDFHANAPVFDNYGTISLVIAPVVNYSTSPNWAGYADQAPTGGQFTDAHMIYTEPTVSCPNTNGYTLFWAGFDGLSPSTTVEQSGTGVDCGSGTPRHFMWTEMYPTENVIEVSGKTVAAGDTIRAQVDYNKTSKVFTLAVTDQMNGQSYSRPALCASDQTCLVTTSEYIAERSAVPAGFTYLSPWNPPFHVIDARAAVDGGTAQSIAWWNNARLAMVNASSQPLARPSPFLDSSAVSFDVLWQQGS